jgi:hypothetical protein
MELEVVIKAEFLGVINHKKNPDVSGFSLLQYSVY